MVSLAESHARCTTGRLRSVRIDAVTERRMTRSTDVAPSIDEVVATAFADLNGNRARRRPQSDILDADRQSARAPRRVGAHARQRLRGVAGRPSQSLSALLGDGVTYPVSSGALVASRRRVAESRDPQPGRSQPDQRSGTGTAVHSPSRSPQQAASKHLSGLLHPAKARRRNPSTGVPVAPRRCACRVRRGRRRVTADDSPGRYKLATGVVRSDPSAVAPTEVRRSKQVRPAGWC